MVPYTGNVQAAFIPYVWCDRHSGCYRHAVGMDDQTVPDKNDAGRNGCLSQKKFHWGNVIGGLLFGLGWAVTGACPGPLFAQIGSGFVVVSVTLLSAIAGTWVYGLLRERLPH